MKRGSAKVAQASRLHPAAVLAVSMQFSLNAKARSRRVATKAGTGRSSQGNVGQGNEKRVMAFIPLTSVLQNICVSAFSSHTRFRRDACATLLAP